jgi:hypothetical protein
MSIPSNLPPGHPLDPLPVIGYQAGGDGPSAGHIQALSICHYVLGAMTCLCALFPVIYVVLGILMLAGNFPPPNRQSMPPGGTEFIGWMFVAMGSVGLVIGQAFGLLTIIAGRKLARRKSWVFCVVVAAICCAGFPLGTALGVFTLIVINRTDVKASFR